MGSIKSGVVISVLSGKGGVGKTTFSINFANIAANHYNRETLLIDANLTCSHIATVLRLEPKYTLRDLLNGRKFSSKKLRSYGNLKVVPAPFHYKPKDHRDITKLKKAVNKLRKNFELIVIDAAPGIGREVIAAIEASDMALCVITPLLPSVVDALRVKEVMAAYPDKELKLLVNMKEGKKYELSKKEIERLTSLEVVGELPYDERINTSFATGEVFSYYNDSSKFIKKLIEVAGDILASYFYIERPRPEGLLTKLLFWRRQ